MTAVTVLGLGAMGSRMAARLLQAGHTVTVWNRDPSRAEALVAAGATPAATPRAAVAKADYALSMVRDDAASEAVWLDAAQGALAGLKPGGVVLESSTISPAWARRLAEQAAAAGHGFLETPVSGSRPQAEAGQLTFLVGGDADLLAAATPLLQAMGSAIQHAGPVGTGAVMKLLVNALLAVQVATVGELIGFAHAAGLSEQRAAEILGATAVASPAAKVAANSIVARAFAPLFPVTLARKDLRYALDAATGAGTRLPMAQAALDRFTEAEQAGFGEQHMSAVARLYLPDAGG